MKAADKMVDVIRDIIQQELDKQDCAVLCEIIGQNDANHYDVYILPDKDNKITNVANMTKFDFSVGEYCYVYKVQNSLINCYICSKVNPGIESVTQATDVSAYLNANY